MPKISVITACYNCQDYIDETISSVLSSTLRDFELIIIDDGSTDASYIKCMSWATQDSRIKVITQANKGVVSARNNAIQLAQADYIYPLDADDKIHPQCLEKLLMMMETKQYDVIYSQVVFFGDKSDIFKLPLPTPEEMIQRNVVVCSALYKKIDWLQYNGYDPMCNIGCEDWDFWLNFIQDNKKFYRIDEVLFYYRVRKQSRNQVISKDSRKIIFNHIKQKYHLLYDKYYRKVKTINRINKILKKIKAPIRLFLNQSKKDKLNNLKVPYRLLKK